MIKNQLKSKISKVMWECYELLYQNSEPSVDFNDLVENSKTDEDGRKQIPFNDYEIDRDVYENIVENTIKKHKLKNLDPQCVRNSIALGCSPKIKKENLKNN